ncbi:Uncharacterised protein [Streptococcus pyogenes]|nr:Uncharacterised protein [Streptococcus pyogenes]
MLLTLLTTDSALDFKAFMVSSDNPNFLAKFIFLSNLDWANFSILPTKSSKASVTFLTLPAPASNICKEVLVSSTFFLKLLRAVASVAETAVPHSSVRFWALYMLSAIKPIPTMAAPPSKTPHVTGLLSKATAPAMPPIEVAAASAPTLAATAPVLKVRNQPDNAPNP